jgi:hypothetical protein
MDMTCSYDCGPSGTAIALLLFGAVIAFALARRWRMSLLLTVPLLLGGVLYAGNTGWGPPLWLVVCVPGLPLLAAIRRANPKDPHREGPA